MTDEFTELDLAKPVDEMEADEARETLSDFMESHRANQDAYDTLQNDLDEVKTEYSEEIEEYEEKLETVKTEYAEQAAEYVNMPSELLVSRFSLDEIKTIIDDGEEFSESTDEADEEDEQNLTTFSEREEKGRKDGGGSSQFRERAENALANKGFPTGGN